MTQGSYLALGRGKRLAEANARRRQTLGGGKRSAEAKRRRARRWLPAVAGYGRFQARPLRLTVARDRSTIMTAVTKQEGNP